LGMIEEARQKLGHLKAVRLAGENKIEETRKQMLKRVFEILQLAGVNLEDRESVAMFLEKMRASNPQLAQWFEESMSVILGNEMPIEEEGMPSGGMSTFPKGMSSLNENQYETPNQEETPLPEEPEALPEEVF